MAPQRGSAGCRGVIGPFPQPLWMKAREAECSTYRVPGGFLTRAADVGANAIAMSYDATEMMGGVTEVLAYGTAVVGEPA